MKFKFQSFVDVATSATSMQVLQWSVGGNEVIERCRHLFPAYKYFKLGSISIKMVPASTLPVDPLGLSYSESDPQTVDPRDQMNPGLVRITNGEDIFTNVSALTADQQIHAYNSMMLDPRWSKFMLQSGFRRSAVPLYWQIGQLSQDKYPGATVNLPQTVDFGTNNVGTSTITYQQTYNTGTPAAPIAGYNVRIDNSSPRGLFQVGHKGRLGYLPTDAYQQFIRNDGSTSNADSALINNVPEVSVITCVLPKAYKTVYYYRVFITETVYFSGLRSSPWVDGNGYSTLGLDQFIYGTAFPTKPNSSFIPALTPDNNNGGDLP